MPPAAQPAAAAPARRGALRDAGGAEPMQVLTSQAGVGPISLSRQVRLFPFEKRGRTVFTRAQLADALKAAMWVSVFRV